MMQGRVREDSDLRISSYQTLKSAVYFLREYCEWSDFEGIADHFSRLFLEDFHGMIIWLFIKSF